MCCPASRAVKGEGEERQVVRRVSRLCEPQVPEQVMVRCLALLALLVQGTQEL